MTARSNHFRVADGAALVVASVVGAGIFTVPGYVASVAGTGWFALSLWIAGGLMALVGALCYAELAARYPQSGAEYIYLRRAFGDTAGFLSGWTSFVAGFSGAIAAAAVGFGQHFVGTIPGVSEAATIPVALGLIWICTAFSLGGVSMSRVANNTMTVMILAGMVILTIAGVFALPSRAVTPATGGLSAVSALVPIFFTYSGWNAAAYVAGEFRNPSRDVPRALIAGTVTVTLLYVGVNLATLAVLPGLPSSAANAPVAAASGVLLGSVGSVIVTMLALAALGSSVCAMIITGPRIYEAMAKDGVLPARFAARDGGSPRTAIIAQSAWTSVLVVTGTFGQLVTYTGFAIVVFSALTVVALVVLRRREGAPRTFAVPLYPVLPILYVIATVLIAISSFRYAPGPSLIGLTLIALGIPLRRFARPFTSLSQVQVRPSGDSP